jgi:hypothetical protein
MLDKKSVVKEESFDPKSMIKYAIHSVLPQTANSKDADLVVRLCIMAAVPTGEENPRDLLREMSDSIVNAFVSNMETIQKNPVSAPVSQFFFLEWCWRNDHFNADWKWEWDASNEGHVSYNPKEPIEKLIWIAKTTCESQSQPILM